MKRMTQNLHFGDWHAAKVAVLDKDFQGPLCLGTNFETNYLRSILVWSRSIVKENR